MDQLEQARHIAALPVPRGTSRRFTCPSCGGHQTLSVTAHPGGIAWLCFRASCPVKGREARERTAAELVDALAYPTEDGDRPLPVFVTPYWWTDAESSPAAMDWVRRFNVAPALAAGWVTMRYDPREDRAVFLVYDEDYRIVDGVGRSLDGSSPKWRRYAAAGLPFVVRPGEETAVIVEDCASACAVAAAGFTAVALMGTRLMSSHISMIRQCERAVIALDPDAASKGLQIQNALSLWMPAKTVLLEDDPKYFSADELRAKLAWGR